MLQKDYKLRFWCQKVLPLVYDESLSYYELLCKVVHHLNKHTEDINALIDIYSQFTEDVESIIEDMIEDGTFSEVLVDSLGSIIAKEYDPDETYLLFDFCIKDGVLYRATGSTTGAWDSTKWTPITVGESLSVLYDRVFGLNAGQVGYSDDASYGANTVGTMLQLLRAATNNENIKIIAGCLRQGDDGWYVYNADAHKPINITTVSVNEDGDLEFYYGFQGTKICSVICVPDETFSEKYSCGTSVTGNMSKVRFFRKPYTLGGIARFSGGSWDITSSDFLTLTTASGVITLTFKNPLTNIITQTQGFQISVQSNKYPVIMDEVTRTHIRFHMIDSDGNTVTSMPSNTEFYIVKPIDGYKVPADSTEFNVSGGNFWVLGLAITTPNS